MKLVKVILLSAGLFCAAASAHDYEAGSLFIDHPWARALPPTAPTGAAYFSISNRGDEGDRLNSAETSIAAYAELHEHHHEDGLMKMRRIDGLDIEPGATADFQPGGLHVMLFNLKQPLVAGESFPLTLHFEQAGSIEVQVHVTDDAPSSSDHHHGDHQGHH